MAQEDGDGIQIMDRLWDAECRRLAAADPASLATQTDADGRCVAFEQPFRGEWYYPAAYTQSNINVPALALLVYRLQHSPFANKHYRSVVVVESGRRECNRVADAVRGLYVSAESDRLLQANRDEITIRGESIDRPLTVTLRVPVVTSLRGTPRPDAVVVREDTYQRCIASKEALDALGPIFAAEDALIFRVPLNRHAFAGAKPSASAPAWMQRQP